MGHQLPYREIEPEPPRTDWPLRRIFLWGMLFVSLGGLAFVGWALTTSGVARSLLERKAARAPRPGCAPPPTPPPEP